MTYFEANPGFARDMTFRMLADGIPYLDIETAGASIDSWAGWLPFWMGRSDMHASVAADVLERRHLLTAGDHFVRAAMCAHFGQTYAWEFPQEKAEAAARKVELYELGGPHFANPAMRLEVPHRPGLPAYLRKPVGRAPFPCVVVIGGLDSSKEDAHTFTNLCLERGMATLAFDGPGQGESFYGGTSLDSSFGESVHAVLDQLVEDQEIDARRIGVIGRSTGGFFALEAAATDPRVAACVAWSAPYALPAFDDLPRLAAQGFRFVTRSADLAAAEAALAFVDVGRFAHEIRCPVLATHGGLDEAYPSSHTVRLGEQVAGPIEIVIIPDSTHCNHDLSYQVRPAMADWLMDQL